MTEDVGDPNTTPLALARHYLELDRHQPALDALARASDDALGDPEYWLVRAEALRGLDRPAEAVDAARRGLELDPDDWILLDVLALGHIDNRRYHEAERALSTAIELAPDNATLHAHQALTFALGKNLRAARLADRSRAESRTGRGQRPARARSGRIPGRESGSLRVHRRSAPGRARRSDRTHAPRDDAGATETLRSGGAHASGSGTP